MNWKHVEESSSSKDCFWINIQDDKGRTIAEVKGAHYDVPNNECRSNARLIAAAPSLLEALENLLKANPNASSWDYPAAWEAARQAVIKARRLYPAITE